MDNRSVWLPWASCVLAQQKREVRQCGWRKFISTVVDSVYPRPVLFCMCIHSGTSLCSACSHVTSAWYGQTWSVYLFHYPNRSFLIVHEQLHTSTKLTLQSCFWKFSHCTSLFVFQFQFPPFVPAFFPSKLVLLTHFPFSHSTHAPLSSRSHLNLFWPSQCFPLESFCAFAIMFTRTADKLVAFIWVSANRMVYLILVLRGTKLSVCN